jgi:hypothetical protein
MSKKKLAVTVSILSVALVGGLPNARLKAAPISPASIVQSSPDLVEVRAVARRGGVAVGPRGGAVAYRGRAVVRPGVRPGWHGSGTRWVRPVPGPRPGPWARPGWYRWPAGGAIAAGAALGFVTATSAAAWAGAAPAPGMCWYYTDPSRTQGFWDYCP